MSSTSSKCVFIFDMMRHRSHLFFRFLGTHPDVKSLWHPYGPASFWGPEGIMNHLKKNLADEKLNVPTAISGETDTFEEMNRKLRQAITEAEEEGKMLATNEHLYNVLKRDLTLRFTRGQDVDFSIQSNPTMIPDNMFDDLLPVFLIREPTFVVQSNYIICQGTDLAPGSEAWIMSNKLIMQRYLFDHFCQRDGKAPLVIDGDDVVWSTDELGEKLGRALSIAPDGFSAEWEVTLEKNRHQDPRVRHFLQTIDDSTGIQKLSVQRPDPDLKKTYSQWVDEFGEPVADHLRSIVKENQPHHDHMARFKI